MAHIISTIRHNLYVVEFNDEEMETIAKTVVKRKTNYAETITALITVGWIVFRDHLPCKEPPKKLEDYR